VQYYGGNASPEAEITARGYIERTVEAKVMEVSIFWWMCSIITLYAFNQLRSRYCTYNFTIFFSEQNKTTPTNNMIVQAYWPAHMMVSADT
jgi:hypothetical protein